MQINDWDNNDVKWMVAAWNYEAKDMVSIAKVAMEKGYNLQFITDKQELFDYINKPGRSDDPIDEMAFLLMEQHLTRRIQINISIFRTQDIKINMHWHWGIVMMR